MATFQAAWRSQALRQLDGDRHLKVAWGPGLIPTLRCIQLLRGSAVLGQLDAEWILSDDSAKTTFEAAEGRWREAMAEVGHQQLMSRKRKLECFERLVQPARRESSTRTKHYAKWRSCVSWALAHKCLRDLLPMTMDTLKTLTWDLLNLECNHGQIQDIWSAIQARHHRFSLPPPVVGRGQFAAWMKSFASFQGQPARLSFPVQKEHVRTLLQTPVQSLGLWRDFLITIVATLCCLRPGEVASLQVCDVMFEYDFLKRGLAQYKGSCAIRVIKRKNDRLRKGLYPRIGATIDTELDVVFRLKAYMKLAKLTVSSGCTKLKHSGARCKRCPPLFPRTTQVRAASNSPRSTKTVMTTQACDTNMVGRAIRRSLSAIGAEGEWYTGKAGRKGGISTALEAGVPEAVLYMQSGHAQDRAARTYMHFSSPALLFDTFKAFGL